MHFKAMTLLVIFSLTLDGNGTKKINNIPIQVQILIW